MNNKKNYLESVDNYQRISLQARLNFNLHLNFQMMIRTLYHI